MVGFVVFVSNGDVATDRNPSRNNADGNREIFLIRLRAASHLSDHEHQERSESNADAQSDADSEPDAYSNAQRQVHHQLRLQRLPI